MEELILNIYKLERDEEGNRIIEKTYKTSSADMMYGAIEEILNVVELDKLDDEGQLLKMLLTAVKQIKPIFKDVFWGLTDDELKRTLSADVVDNTVKILKYVVGETLLDETLKNAKRV